MDATTMYEQLRELQTDLHGLDVTQQALDLTDQDDAGPALVDGELVVETFAERRTRLRAAVDALWADQAASAPAAEVRELLDANEQFPRALVDVPSVLPDDAPDAT